MILVLLSTTAKAQEFVKSTAKPETVSCSLHKNAVVLAKSKLSYELYEKNLKSIKILKCEQIKIGEQTFYTVLHSGEIQEAMGTQKILVYDVTLLDKKTLKTVRSEVVDQMELSGDPASTDFSYAAKTQWGQAKADKSVMLQIEISAKNDKADPYLLKLNNKSMWFENVFATEKK